MNARRDAAKYMRLYEEFKQDLQEHNVQEWLQSVRDWEKDPSRDDPYDLSSSGKSSLDRSYVPYI